MAAIYDTLMRATETKQYDGRTAQSWVPNADFTQWTLTLKSGLNH